MERVSFRYFKKRGVNKMIHNNTIRNINSLELTVEENKEFEYNLILDAYGIERV